MKRTDTLGVYRVCMVTLVILLSGVAVFSQAVPEYMYFKFDAAGNQQNYASAPVGTNPAVLSGMTTGNTGQFGTALIGNGLTSTSNFLNTGWATNLPSTGWTISFWLNNFPATSSTTFYYFGDNTAGSFRCFTGGVAGNGNLLLRGTGLTDVPINGIPSTPTVIHLVYTGTAVKVFTNGALTSTVAQSAVTFAGTGPFKVGGYSSSNCINAGTLMDEFRLYNRALSDLEVNQTWNQQLPVVTGGPPIVTTNAATAVTSTTATLNGTVQANNASTTVSFEYGLTTSYGSVVAGVPATLTGNVATAVTGAITGLVPGTLYHYRVKGVNSFGTTNGGDMTFTTPPALPVVVTTAATSVTTTTAVLNGTVNAGGANTAVSFEYGLTTSYGTVVPGVPATVSGNTVTAVSASISGLALNTTYHFRVIGVNSAGTGTGTDMTFVTTSCPMPGSAGVITGPAAVCGNSPGNVYTVPVIANATGYVWSLPAGATITAGANTNTITVTVGNTAGTVSVYGTNTCGNGTASNLSVTVNPAPVPTITGPVSMCVNSGYYNYTTQPGMSNYTWTISSGGVITWGAGTNQVQVQWTGAGAQSISVNYSSPNGCYAGVPTVLPVTVNPLPGNAGAITGVTTVCAGAMGITYSVAPINNAVTYVWTLPAGGVITAGEWTNTITVAFEPDAVSGNITVYGNNLCGNGSASAALAVTVNPLPGAAGTITGPATVCQGTSGVVYSVPPIPNATGYQWTLPAGATIASGSNTPSITVDFSAVAMSGLVSVKGSNTCGVGIQSDLSVSVYPVPGAPVITQSGDQLMSSAATGNQWYLNGAAIPGANAQSYIPVASGDYTCVVTLMGCSSDPSNVITVIITGVEIGNGTNSLTLFPNPTEGLVNLVIANSSNEKIELIVVNSLGKVVYNRQNLILENKIPHQVDLNSLPSGIYWLRIRTSQQEMVRKLIVN